MKSRGESLSYILGTTYIYFPRAIERILNRVLLWASYTERTAFFKQNEIQVGIDECYRELSACSNRFAVRTFFHSAFFMKPYGFHFNLPLDSIIYGG
jgi:hypothetical protein